jgi:integrase
VWTAKQTAAFLDHSATDDLYALYHLVALRGLRRGEAVQLGWDTAESPPKAGSVRTIPLDATTTEVLRAHRARQAGWRLAAGPAWTDTRRVFTHRDGTGLHPHAVTAHFRELTKAAGLPPIRLHDLRHGAATLALAAEPVRTEVGGYNSGTHDAARRQTRLGHQQRSDRCDSQAIRSGPGPLEAVALGG